MLTALRHTGSLTLAVCFLAACSGCSDLTAPRGEDPKQLRQPTSDKKPRSEGKSDTVGASHILVAYQGASRAAQSITRNKDEARAVAAKLAEKAKADGADFEALAREHSDDPGSGKNGGRLGTFSRESMTRKFSEAAFALGVGQISDVVETEFGFHIIKRTQ